MIVWCAMSQAKLLLANTTIKWHVRLLFALFHPACILGLVRQCVLAALAVGMLREILLSILSLGKAHQNCRLTNGTKDGRVVGNGNRTRVVGRFAMIQTKCLFAEPAAKRQKVSQAALLQSAVLRALDKVNLHDHHSI